MAEGGGCYGCVTLSNARRGPVDPGQIGGVAWSVNSGLRKLSDNRVCVLCSPFGIDVKMGN